VPETMSLGCAHCSDERGENDSMDTRPAVYCPACLEFVCPSCASVSTGQHCGHFSDALDWPECLSGADYYEEG